MIGETKELRLRFREGREAEKTVCRPLFLMADESETMLARYLDRARLFVAEAADEGNVLNVGIVASALVTNEGGGVAELKNLAVQHPSQQLPVLHCDTQALNRTVLQHQQVTFFLPVEYQAFQMYP